MLRLIGKYALAALLIGGATGLSLTALPQSAQADDDWEDYWDDYRDWHRRHRQRHLRHRYYDDRYYDNRHYSDRYDSRRYYYDDGYGRRHDRPPYSRYGYRYGYRPYAGVRLGPFRFDFWH